MLCRNWHTRFSSGAKFLETGGTVFKKGVPVVVLEMCLSVKALGEVECNLETVEME